jgi:hypothetical protein
MGIDSQSSSFLEVYLTEIAPQLQTIDIILKSMEEPLSVAEASEALFISEDELKNIMKKLNIVDIDQQSFVKIMGIASSPICKLYQREVDVGSPYVYTREDIAYIYCLPIEAVNQACEDLGFSKLTAYTLPDLFSRVSLQPAEY